MYLELINSATPSYPFLKEHKNVRYVPHFHDETEIVYVIKGELELTIGSSRYIVMKDDICIIPTEVIHNLYTYTTSETFVIKLYPIVDLSGIQLDKYVITSKDSCYACLKEHIDTIMREAQDKKSAYEIAVNASAEKLSILLLREFEHTGKNQSAILKHNSEKDFLKEVINFLEQNLNTDFNLDDISNQFNYSKGYFCRQFKRITGMSLWEYYTIYRIEKSARLIKQTPSENLTIIAHKSGFKNTRSFNIAFKTYYGCTPSEYRKKHYHQK